jgi:hypothetical protein
VERRQCAPGVTVTRPSRAPAKRGHARRRIHNACLEAPAGHGRAQVHRELVADAVPGGRAVVGHGDAAGVQADRLGEGERFDVPRHRLAALRVGLVVLPAGARAGRNRTLAQFASLGRLERLIVHYR